MPSRLESSSPREGALIAITPAKPTASPAICNRPGRCRTTIAATRAVNSGAAALIIPASDESIHCWATEKNMNGNAIQSTPSSAMSGHSERGTARRASAMRTSVTAPKSTRRNATRPGSKLSTPMSMNRNDEPQLNATPPTSSQSRPAKAWVPSRSVARGRGAVFVERLTRPRLRSGRARAARGRRGAGCSPPPGSSWSSGYSPPPLLRRQRRVLPARIGVVQVHARWHDLVDAVEELVGELHLGGRQLRLEVLHGARTDDRRGDGRMADDEGERQLDQAEVCLLRELRQRLRRVELALVL